MILTALIFSVIASFFLAIGAFAQAKLDFSELHEKYRAGKQPPGGNALLALLNWSSHLYRSIRLTFAWGFVFLGAICAFVASFLAVLAH